LNSNSKDFESAILLANEGRFTEAEALMEGLRLTYGEDFRFNFYLGAINFNLGRLKDAERHLKKSINQKNDSPLSRHMLGAVFIEQGEFDKALQQFNIAISLDEKNPDLLNDKGELLQKMGNFKEAVEVLLLAVSYDPQFKDALNNLGICLCSLNLYKEAKDVFQKAVDIEPKFFASHSNLALALQMLNETELSMKSLNIATQLNPEDKFSRWNKANLLLLLDMYKEAWPLYELRWDTVKKNDRRSFIEPLWLGSESIAGKKIFIHAEQGFGDVIQCARFVPLLKSMDARVTLEVPTELHSLMSLMDGVEVVTKNKAHEGCDFHCPIMSLPYAFKTSLHNIPTHEYLTHFSVDKNSVFSKRVHKKNNLLNVGICWSGSNTLVEHYKRSIDLEIIKPLLELQVNFHVVQKEVKPDEKNILEGLGVNCCDNIITNFFDTASLIECMDLVITIDTSVAHLSATLNKNTWVLLPYVPDWRWGLDRKDCPWYSTASLYRQTLPSSWLEPLNEITKDLTKLIKERSALDI
jgi:Tfp pilus assembly protein PilF/ADP-heptose:LPS heptosyltransferase